MEEGEPADAEGVAIAPKGLLENLLLGVDAFVGDHHAFGDACRAGGELEEGKGLRRDAIGVEIWVCDGTE